MLEKEMAQSTWTMILNIWIKLISPPWKNNLVILVIGHLVSPQKA